MLWKKKKVPFYTPCQEIPLSHADKWRYLDMTTRHQMKIAANRMLGITILAGICFLLLGVRLFQLTVLNFNGHHFDNSIQTEYILQRHNILDRNGVLLATNMRTYDLSVNPALIKEDVNQVAENISHALVDVSKATVLEALTSSAGFEYIKRNITPKERKDINWLGYYFLTATPVEKRIYPQGRLLSHLLGGVDVDNYGIAGIEKAYDNQLTQEDVQLSIDVSVQEIVYNALTEGIKKFQATGGLAVVMNVENGEILASVSLPDYDPNLRAKKAGKERFNQVSLGTYEFGSIFKLFNVALGLESQTITVSSSFDARKPLKLEGRGVKPIEDYMGQARILTVPEILILSSNIGAAQIGLKIGAPKQRAFFDQLNFYKKLPIPLSERGVPQGIYKKDKWNEVESSRLSYGYGLAVSPLHLIAGVGALVNGGIYYTPTFIKGQNDTQVGVQIISENTSQFMRHMMWAVVNWELKESDPIGLYAVGGKTGSRQSLIDGKYVEGKLRTSFVGVFPMNAPKYAVLVSIEDPKKIADTHRLNTAGWNAKPIGLRIISEIAPYLGVEPVLSWTQPAYITRAIEKSKNWKKEH